MTSKETSLQEVQSELRRRLKALEEARPQDAATITDWRQRLDNFDNRAAAQITQLEVAQRQLAHGEKKLNETNDALRFATENEKKNPEALADQKENLEVQRSLLTSKVEQARTALESARKSILSLLADGSAMIGELDKLIRSSKPPSRPSGSGGSDSTKGSNDSAKHPASQDPQADPADASMSSWQFYLVRPRLREALPKVLRLMLPSAVLRAVRGRLERIRRSLQFKIAT